MALLVVGMERSNGVCAQYTCVLLGLPDGWLAWAMRGCTGGSQFCVFFDAFFHIVRHTWW